MKEPTDRRVIWRAMGLGVLAPLFAVFSRGSARAVDALIINPNGEVAIDKLSVQSGLAVAGPVTIAGKNTLEFGAGVQGKEASAGKIGYQTWTADALDIVGAGPTIPTRKIKFHAEGGATFNGDVVVDRTITANAFSGKDVTLKNSLTVADADGAKSLRVPK